VDFGEGSRSSFFLKETLCPATAIACSAISFEQQELLSAFLLRRSSRRCDKFLNSSQNYYHTISSVIGSSHPLPMCVSFNLFRINFHEATSSFVTFHQFFVIILLDEEVRVLDHSNSCRVVEDFKLSIFSQNPK
jgi:hypothetical protein